MPGMEYADTTGILRAGASSVAARPSFLTGEVDGLLDAAVGRGAVGSKERAAWRKRYERAPEMIADVLRVLPGDAERAERSFAEDERLRSLTAQFDRLMEVEPPKCAYNDPSLSDSERLYRRLAAMTNAPDAR